MSGPVELHLVLPDVSGPTGGNAYDRRIATELAAPPGWSVRRTEVPGSWPDAGADSSARLAAVLAAVPDGGVVLVDGLVACAVPDVVEPAARRLRIIVLVHLPLPDETGVSADVALDLTAREARTLRSAAAVVVTSPWAARRLERYDLAPGVVHVATPGTDAAPVARGSRARGGVPELLCVAAVTPRKDQLTLVNALGQLADLPWTCTCVGPVEAAPAYVSQVQGRIDALGLGDRVRLVGPRAGDALAASYDRADLFVLVSRTETYGMVITEALSRGLPVVTAAGGAAEQTLGRTGDGAQPGLLVPPGDCAALASALRRWLTDDALRADVAGAAARRRLGLHPWHETARALASVVELVRAGTPVGS